MNVNIPKTVVQETFRLPSGGRLYGKDFPSEVTIRSMTTFEEKMRLGNQSFYKIICNILNSVVTSPEKFDAQRLTSFDFFYLMYMMRSVSYGTVYRVTVTCPNCGKQTVVPVELDKLSVDYLPEDFTEPFEVGPLPRSKDTLGCKFLRISDIINNERRARDILKDHPDYIGDPDYILSRAAQIVTINGEEVSPIQSQMYVESMDAMDTAYYDQAYIKHTNNVGLDTECSTTCESCGEEIEFRLPFTSEFFRPTFDI